MLIEITKFSPAYSGYERGTALMEYLLLVTAISLVVSLALSILGRDPWRMNEATLRLAGGGSTTTLRIENSEARDE